MKCRFSSLYQYYISKFNSSFVLILSVVTMAVVTTKTVAANAATSLAVYAEPGYEFRSDDASKRGFHLIDGAAYLKHSFQAGALFVDMPIKWSQEDEDDDDEIDQNNSLSVFTDKAQLYFHRQWTERFALTIGQFDTPYGFESNDSKDNAFVGQGLLFQNFFPLTHTGLMAEYGSGFGTLYVVAANPVNANNSPDDRYDLGAYYRVVGKKMTTNIGYMGRIGSGTSDGNRHELADLNWSWQATDKLSFVLEAVTLWQTDEPDYGSMAIVTWKLAESLNLSVRGEWVDYELRENEEMYSLNFTYALSEHERIRIEWQKLLQDTEEDIAYLTYSWSGEVFSSHFSSP